MDVVDHMEAEMRRTKLPPDMTPIDDAFNLLFSSLNGALLNSDGREEALRKIVEAKVYVFGLN